MNPVPVSQGAISFPIPPNKTSSITPSLVVEKDKQFKIENEYYQIEFQTNGGFFLSKLIHKQSERNTILQPFSILTVTVDGNEILSDQWRLIHYQTEENELQFVLSPLDETIPLRARISISADRTNQCGLSLRLENVGYTPLSVRFRFPRFAGRSIERRSIARLLSVSPQANGFRESAHTPDGCLFR